MPAFLLLTRHPQALLSLLLSFVRWYVVEEPVRILMGAIAYLRAFLEIFSFTFLLRTLFAPWKQITDAYPKKGLNISATMQTLTLNITSRVIGMVFRLVTFVVGITALGLFVLCAASYLLLWLSFPLLAIALPIVLL